MASKFVISLVLNMGKKNHNSSGRFQALAARFMVQTPPCTSFCKMCLLQQSIIEYIISVRLFFDTSSCSSFEEHLSWWMIHLCLLKKNLEQLTTTSSVLAVCANLSDSAQNAAERDMKLNPIMCRKCCTYILHHHHHHHRHPPEPLKSISNSSPTVYDADDSKYDSEYSTHILSFQMSSYIAGT